MLGFFRKPRKASSSVAKDRLQILLAHERTSQARADFIPLLKRDILEVIKRHARVDGESVDIQVERSDDFSTLEINIELPEIEPLAARSAS